MQTTSRREQTFLLPSLMHGHQIDDAESTRQKLADDSTERIGWRQHAVEALLERRDINEYMLWAFTIIQLHEQALNRS